METWQTVVSYEGKLVRRNWLFYLFVVGVLGYASVFLIPWDIHRGWWSRIVFASSIPMRGVYFLNLLQSLVVVFLVCDIQRRRNKAESREVLFVRPLTNARMFWAELVGMALPFLVVDVVFMAFCLFINLVIPDSPTNLWVYFSFLVRDVLPTLAFVTGLSLLVNRVLRHFFLSWVVLTVFFGVSYLYLVEPLHGILDFRGSLLPESFSSIVGFVHSEACLLQRGVFLLLGLGLLCVAVPFARRLCDVPSRHAFYHVMGGVLLVLAVGMGYAYVEKFRIRQENRKAYREAFSRYEEYPKVRIETHDITYKSEGNRFSAESWMTVVNRKAEKLERLILFLNPGLEISNLTSEDGDVPFRRDRQVVVVERSLAPGDSVVLEMKYGGYIDQDVYQVDIDDDRYFAPRRQTRWVERLGKGSAFVSGNYTLLIPEVLWYPAAVAPVALQPSRETDFTDYTLRVKNPKGRMVLSQGVTERRHDEVMFRNLQALTGLSLCMGDYVKRSVVVDSVTLEFYTYPGNDFYLKPFDGWMDKIATKPNTGEYWKELVGKCRDRVEENMPNAYPFKFLKIVEAPSSFLHDYSFHNNVQPEMVFFGERMWESYDKPGDLSLDKLREESVQEHMLFHDFPPFLASAGVERLFADFHWSVASDRYAGIDMLFGKMANPTLDKLPLFPSMLDSIAPGGLEGIIRGEYFWGYDKLVGMKVNQLLAYLTTITTWDSVCAYTREFYESARFREVDFDVFMEGFRERFGQDIQPFVDEWYTTREIPRLVIKDLVFRQTKEIKSIDFMVGNMGKVDGLVSVIESYSDDNGKWVIKNWRGYLVKPGEYKRIVACQPREMNLFLTTNFARSVPERFMFGSHGVPLWKGDLPGERVEILDRDQFYPPGEIIVDNEDEGFHLIDSAGSKLKRLAERLAKEDEEEYRTGSDFKKGSWGRPVIKQDGVYGEEILSAFIKIAGNGNCKAIWTTDLPETGKYEIFVYQSRVSAGAWECSYESNYPGMKNYYTVDTPEGSKEIELERTRDDTGWGSLGVFDLSAGKSRVVLDDRGMSSFEVTEKWGNDKYAQVVVADAVKWVKVK